MTAAWPLTGGGPPVGASAGTGWSAAASTGGGTSDARQVGTAGQRRAAALAFVSELRRAFPWRGMALFYGEQAAEYIAIVPLGPRLVMISDPSPRALAAKLQLLPPEAVGERSRLSPTEGRP